MLNILKLDAPYMHVSKIDSSSIASTETHTAVGNTGQTCNATKTYTHSRNLTVPMKIMNNFNNVGEIHLHEANGRMQ
jgi:hypothetical protein